MYCKKCGAQLEDTALFCKKCGQSTQDKKSNGAVLPKSITIKTQWLWLFALVVLLLLVGITAFFFGRNMGYSNKEDERQNHSNSTAWEDEERKAGEDGEADEEESNPLYGVWTDSEEKISFTFRENGSIRVSGLTNVLGADLFTFTEIDDETLELRPDTNYDLLNGITLDLKYRIFGNEMAIEIAEQTYILIKR